MSPRDQTRTGRGPSPEELLRPFPPPVRALANDLRRRIRAAVPSLEERVYPGWRALGYRDPQAGYVVGLFPRSDRIDLAFERGVWLDDPDGLFAPAENLRQVRYVPVRTAAEAARPELARMLRRAVVAGS